MRVHAAGAGLRHGEMCACAAGAVTLCACHRSCNLCAHRRSGPRVTGRRCVHTAGAVLVCTLQEL